MNFKYYLLWFAIWFSHTFHDISAELTCDEEDPNNLPPNNYEQTLLGAINRYRTEYDSQHLQLANANDNTLGKEQLHAAAKTILKTNNAAPVNHLGLGQSAYFTDEKPEPEDIVGQWYAERNEYKAAIEDFPKFKNFASMIWKASAAVSCTWCQDTTAEDPTTFQTVVLCRYKPGVANSEVTLENLKENISSKKITVDGPTTISAVSPEETTGNPSETSTASPKEKTGNPTKTSGINPEEEKLNEISKTILTVSSVLLTIPPVIIFIFSIYAGFIA